MPALASSSKTSSTSRGSPGSCSPTRPNWFDSAIAASVAVRISSCESGGMTRSMSAIALSTKTPVGSPFAPRSMRPPAGSFVAAVTPAALHRRGVGEHGVAVDALEHDRIVRRDARQRFVRGEARVAPFVLIPAAADRPSGRPARLRDVGGDARDDLVVRARVGEVDVCAGRSPSPKRWAWASIMPGMTVWPAGVDARACWRPRSSSASRTEPTNGTRPSRTAIAPTNGCESSTV